MVALLKDIGAAKGATPAQFALAWWLLAQRPWIVPIPGTRRLDRARENTGAAKIPLIVGDLERIAQASARIKVQGARLPEALLQLSCR